MLYFPPFLGGAILEPGLVSKGLLPFASFCFASSATYAINDILDRKRDLEHPRKKKRPIPSGKISPAEAAVVSGLLFLFSISIALFVSKSILYILISYMVITLGYSIKLKDVPIVDLFCISAGFILRLEAGGIAFGIMVSEWLFLSVFLLSIFLSTGKRLYEKNAMGEKAGHHRKSLLSYPAGFLDGAMYMTGGSVLVTYTMYAVTRPALVYTVPLCAFGLLRYIMRVQAGLGGDPTESLLRDVPLFVTGAVWAIIVGLSIYY